MRICRLLLQDHFLPTKSWWVLPILPGAYIVRNIIIIMSVIRKRIRLCGLKEECVSLDYKLLTSVMVFLGFVDPGPHLRFSVFPSGQIINNGNKYID